MIQQNEIEEGQVEKDEKFSKSPAWRYKVKKVSTSKREIQQDGSWILKLSYNFWYRCSIMFLKSDKKHDKAIKTVIVHSKTNVYMKID